MPDPEIVFSYAEAPRAVNIEGACANLGELIAGQLIIWHHRRAAGQLGPLPPHIGVASENPDSAQITLRDEQGSRVYTFETESRLRARDFTPSGDSAGEETTFAGDETEYAALGTLYEELFALNNPDGTEL